MGRRLRVKDSQVRHTHATFMGISLVFYGCIDEEFPVLEFSPQGSSSGGVIEVASDRGKTLFIVVNRITGKVVIEEAD